MLDFLDENLNIKLLNNNLQMTADFSDDYHDINYFIYLLRPLFPKDKKWYVLDFTSELSGYVEQASLTDHHLTRLHEEVLSKLFLEVYHDRKFNSDFPYEFKQEQKFPSVFAPVCNRLVHFPERCIGKYLQHICTYIKKEIEQILSCHITFKEGCFHFHIPFIDHNPSINIQTAILNFDNMEDFIQYIISSLKELIPSIVPYKRHLSQLENCYIKGEQSPPPDIFCEHLSQKAYIEKDQILLYKNVKENAYRLSYTGGKAKDRFSELQKEFNGNLKLISVVEIESERRSALLKILKEEYKSKKVKNTSWYKLEMGDILYFTTHSFVLRLPPLEEKNFIEVCSECAELLYFPKFNEVYHCEDCNSYLCLGCRTMDRHRCNKVK
ncbi:hypothetical protein [Alkalihalobacillus sp. BA299]|uniref:hypothetical protein n=1 Tax=Alkalihalobacillus sp. BA299 TaxID=2815938 RepID=UPI001ADBAEDD|nr:hypothetical protein [Alkalihalobacillus sp. BA299]